MCENTELTKISKLAKQLSVSSAEVMQIIKKLNINIGKHQNLLTAEEVILIKKHIHRQSANQQQKQLVPKTFDQLAALFATGTKKQSKNTITKQNKPAIATKRHTEKKKEHKKPTHLTQEQWEKYLAYANSEESRAVLFAKKHLKNATNKYWVDIVHSEEYDICGYCDDNHSEICPCEMKKKELQFRVVECGLFERKIKPKYPPKEDYFVDGKFDEDEYYFAVRAITWQAAHDDIASQKQKGIVGIGYVINGVRYCQNKKRPYFREDAPPEIKALANNLNDRTNILWNEALAYASKDEWVYEIKSIKKITR